MEKTRRMTKSVGGDLQIPAEVVTVEVVDGMQNLDRVTIHLYSENEGENPAELKLWLPADSFRPREQLTVCFCKDAAARDSPATTC